MSEGITSAETKALTGFKGMLVIGDAWLGAPRRAGRVDEPWDASLGKLVQALDIAKERKLLPVLMGDLYHEKANIGQLVPIISLLSKRKAILVPRNSRWQEQSQSHIAAILRIAGVAQVAGACANQFQLNISQGGELKQMMIEAHTSWGGKTRTEPGTPAYLKIAGMDLTVMLGSTLPLIEGDESGTRIVAGRLLRLTPVEEKQKVNVYAVTLDGIEAIPLNILPVVFSTTSAVAGKTNEALKQDSKFVEMLRNSGLTSAEEVGKESVIELCDMICDKRKSDDWVRAKILQLAKAAVEMD